MNIWPLLREMISYQIFVARMVYRLLPEDSPDREKLEARSKAMKILMKELPRR